MTEPAVLRMALAASLSCIVTGACAWFGFGNNTATTEDMDKTRQVIVELYDKDREIIDLRLDASTADMMALRSIVTSLVVAQAGLATEQRVLLERVNMLLAMPEDR